MKKLFLLYFLLLSVLAFSQEQKLKNLPNFDRKWLHFGFTVGLSIFDASMLLSDEFLQTETSGEYTINHVYGIENTPSPGFHLGPIVNLRINEYSDLRALIDLSFGQRTLKYSLLDTINTSERAYNEHVMKIESIFLELPIQYKYKAKRLNNIRPYVIFGVTTKWDMAANKKIKDEDRPMIRFKPFDVFWEAGMGVDFYLPYFKFSSELKYQVGLLNIVKYDNTQYTNALSKINSRMFVLSFHFE
jgi:hypothetical protein